MDTTDLIRRLKYNKYKYVKILTVHLHLSFTKTSYGKQLIGYLQEIVIIVISVIKNKLF